MTSIFDDSTAVGEEQCTSIVCELRGEQKKVSPCAARLSRRGENVRSSFESGEPDCRNETDGQGFIQW
jgi:hypothetical protein